MRFNSLIILCSIGAMLVLAGCPRDTGAEDTTESMSATAAMNDAADNVASDAAGVLDVDTQGDDEEAVDGEKMEAEETSEDETAEQEDTAADNAEGDTEAATDEPGAEMTDDAKAGDVTMVVLETSKGDVVLEVHADWSPLGAAHFLELVKAGFYDGAPWFRVFKDPGGISVAQCGIAADPDVTAAWQQQTILDEPVVMGNKKGTVAFGKSGAPNSRSTHIFVNLSDNAFALDPQGFSCFAIVAEGYDIVDSLTETGSGAVDQYQLSMQGIDYFYQVVPDGDVIKKAYIRE